MREAQFIALCESRLIDAQIALENIDIQSALLERDDERVREILDEQF